MTDTHFEDGKHLTTVENEVYVPYAEEEAQPIAEFISKLHQAAAGLTNVRVTGDFFSDSERNQYGVWVNVLGDRLATQEEIAAFEVREAARREKEAQWAAAETQSRAEKKEADDRRALARAREAYPDLFKEE